MHSAGNRFPVADRSHERSLHCAHKEVTLGATTGSNKRGLSPCPRSLRPELEEAAIALQVSS